jgi:hypothetical protein
MKLYDLKRGDLFRLSENPKVPPGAFKGELGLIYTFTHVDGMYCPCHDTTDNDRYYFAAWTEVEKV